MDVKAMWSNLSQEKKDEVLAAELERLSKQTDADIALNVQKLEVERINAEATLITARTEEIKAQAHLLETQIKLRELEEGGGDNAGRGSAWARGRGGG